MKIEATTNLGGAAPSPMSQIEHVVLLMMENRSFDSLLGWLYEAEGDRHLHRIPDTPDARDYEGLQGLDLTKYTNSSLGTSERFNIDLSFRGVLGAGNFVEGNWAATATLNQPEGVRRSAVIDQLVAHSNKDRPFFDDNHNADDLIGMAGAIIYLLGRGAADLAVLKNSAPDDHRNGLRTTMFNIEKALRRGGKSPILPGTDDGEIVRLLQGQSTKSLVARRPATSCGCEPVGKTSTSRTTRIYM